MNNKNLDLVLSYLNESDERKGYVVPDGYMGWNPEEKKYQLFETEGEYNDWYNTHFGE